MSIRTGNTCHTRSATFSGIPIRLCEFCIRWIGGFHAIKSDIQNIL
jgi:hypothetical protein